MEQPAPPSYIEVVTNPSYSISPPLEDVNQNDPEYPSSSISEDEGSTDVLNDSSNEIVSEDLAETSRLRSIEGADDYMAANGSRTFHPLLNAEQQLVPSAPNLNLNDIHQSLPSYEEVLLYSGSNERPTHVQRTSPSNVSRDSTRFDQPPPSYDAVVNTSHGAHFNPGFSNAAQSRDSAISSSRTSSANINNDRIQPGAVLEQIYGSDLNFAHYNPGVSNAAQSRDSAISNTRTSSTVSYINNERIQPGAVLEQIYGSDLNGNFNNQGYQRMPYMGNTSTSTTAGTGSYTNTDEQSTPRLVVYNAIINPSISTSNISQAPNTATSDNNNTTTGCEQSTAARYIPFFLFAMIVVIALGYYIFAYRKR